MNTTDALPNPGLVAAAGSPAKVTPQALAGHDFAAGSMGPKVEAARVFVRATDQRAVIGSLEQIEDMLAASAGIQVCLATAGGADPL